MESFQQTEEWEKEYNNFFRKHEIIEVFYEDLIGHADSVMREIHNFLGISHFKGKTHLKRQNKLPLPQSISNYRELKNKFLNTRWDSYFKE